MITKDIVIEQLLAEMSLRNIDLVTQLFIDESADIKILVDIILLNDNKESFRASWVLDKLSEKLHKPATNYISNLIYALNKIQNSGTRRTITKVLMLHDIPRNDESRILDFCITALESPKEPVAVKANCITLIFKLLPKYPELKNEMFAIIEDQIPKSSGALKGRYKLLKKKFEM